MKNRGVAIVVCFFLGGLGIHKFYLGQNLAGIVYLLFSWTLIPGLIAFVEFFMLLFMSDREFDAKFNGRSGSFAGGAVSAKDATGALGDLKKLYEQGVITAEEYEQKRRKLLDHL